MLIVERKGQDRMDITLDGVLDSALMEAGLSELIEKSVGMSQAKMLYTIVGFDMPTMGALGVEVKFLPKLMSLVGRFSKCAVVSDLAWLRTVAEIEGALIPGLEINAYPPDEADKAEAWLAAG